MITTSRLVAHVFFFGLLAGAAYLVWKLVAPFAGALALAAIVVTICYPIYEWVRRHVPRNNATFASLLSVFLVLIVVVLPLTILGSFILKEALSIYNIFNNGAQESLERVLSDTESLIQTVIPSFSLDIATYVRHLASFIATNIGSIFAGTASTVFLFFIALMGAFYFFRDGKRFTRFAVRMSPLPDDEDEIILRRLARAIRSVALGIVLVAIIQGTLTGIGLHLFGFDRAILWGSVAAIGALIPGIGTTIVFIPAIVFLLMGGDYMLAAGVALWAVLAVGFIDNILGPYLMSRGNKLHPFIILISVLGGIALFGPIGFILGPVFVSLFAVLLEIYAKYMHIADDQQ